MNFLLLIVFINSYTACFWRNKESTSKIIDEPTEENITENAVDSVKPVRKPPIRKPKKKVKESTRPKNPPGVITEEILSSAPMTTCKVEGGYGQPCR